MITLTAAAVKAIIDELKATGNFLDALTLHLYKSPGAPTRQTVLGDLTEADFTGYAAVALGAWGADWTDPAGNWHVTAPSIQFTATGSAVSNDIYGYYVTATVGGNPVLRYVEAFDQGPFGIARAGDALIVVPDFSLYDLATALVQGP